MRQAKPLLVGVLAALVLSAGQAIAEGDAAAGAKVFKKCKACHTLDGKHRVGPTLQGIFGRQAGTAEGYKYSGDMKAAGEAGLVWDEKTLRTYIKKGGKKGLKYFVGSYIGKDKAKTKMAFPGLKKDADIENLIAYLKENAQ
ncbi:MAG: c-type cytochrome [Kiloniellales bacterium]